MGHQPHCHQPQYCSHWSFCLAKDPLYPPLGLTVFILKATFQLLFQGLSTWNHRLMCSCRYSSLTKAHQNTAGLLIQLFFGGGIYSKPFLKLMTQAGIYGFFSYSLPRMLSEQVFSSLRSLYSHHHGNQKVSLRTQFCKMTFLQRPQSCMSLCIWHSPIDKGS